MPKFIDGLELASGTLTLDGSAAPEGSVSAPLGSIYHRSNGAMYVKTAGGTGNTGWLMISVPAREVIVWSGSAYAAKRSTFALYVGPTDPATVGITLASGDAWENTAAVTPIDPVSLASLPADVANSTTSFAALTGLSFAVKAGVAYLLEYALSYDAAATSTGSAWDISGPAMTSYQHAIFANSSAAAQTGRFGATPSDASAPSASLTTGNSARYTVTLVPSADGDIMPRFRSTVAGSAITVKAKVSAGRLTRLP